MPYSYIVMPGARLSMKNGHLMESTGACCGPCAQEGVSEVLTEAAPVIGLAGAAAATYHGYKRNQSVGWAVGWGVLGGFFPIITNVIAVAQGFGKKKK